MGDGGAHLHVFLLARPSGFAQLRGTYLAVWDDLLPAIRSASVTPTRQQWPKRSPRPTAASPADLAFLPVEVRQAAG
jgi:hypothetical protein